VPDEHLYKFLRRFTDLRTDETRPALDLFVYFFLITFSIYIVKPVKESFLIGITPTWWPYADIITAGLIGFVVAFNTKLLNRLPRRSYFSCVSISFALTLIGFWCIFKIGAPDSTLFLSGKAGQWIHHSWPMPVLAFSFWCDVFIVMSVTHFWLTVNDVLNLRQAKRTVSFFVSGGLLGGIAGSLLTTGLASSLGSVNLLLICPVVLLVILILINRLYAVQKKLPNDSTVSAIQERPGYLRSLSSLKRNKYLRILAAAIAAAIITGCLINYQFKIAIQQAIPTAARTSFLGKFFLVILLISAIFHMVSTGLILKKFGIRLGLLLAPSVLCVVTIAVFLFPAAGLIAWACFIRGSDKTFENTLSQSLRELLYLPIPANIKYEAKIFIDMFVNKLAVGLGAVLVWFLYHHVAFFAHSTPTAQIHQLGFFVMGFAIICIILVWRIHGEYLGAVKKDLSRKWQDAHEVLSEHVDVNAAHLIVDTLQSRERSSTLYAMNLFQLIRKESLSPELKAVFSLREDQLQARSMDSLLDVGGDVIYPGIEEALADEETETMVREVMALDSYGATMETQLRTLMQDRSASEVERMETAKLISFLKPTPIVIECLSYLLQDTSPDVLNYALSSAAIHRCPDHAPLLVRLLGNPMTRSDAQGALAAYGSGIEDMLQVHLHDTDTAPDLRSALPEILASIGNQKAADILCAELSSGSSESMEQDLIDALYKIRVTHPMVHFKKKRIKNIVLSLIKKSYTRYLSTVEADLNAGSAASIRESNPLLELKAKQIFDLLALMHPPEDIVKAYQNIMLGTHTSVDNSLELLDNVLDRDIASLLFPIVEDLPPEDRILRMKKLVPSLDQRLAAARVETAGRST
jgi:ATP:ADP antiporter, AAA family